MASLQNNATLLVESGANVNKRAKRIDTMLIQAVMENDINTVHCLIESGVDVNVPGLKGRTPLMIAAYNTGNQCIDLLIEAAADVNAVDKILGYTALMCAVKIDHFPAVKKLIHAGAHVNVVSRQGMTALKLAMEQGHDLCVQTLIQAGATIDGTTVDSATHDQYSTPNVNLKNVCRETVRKRLLQLSHLNLFVTVPQLDLPFSLINYLLFTEHCTGSIDDDEVALFERSKERISSCPSLVHQMEKTWGCAKMLKQLEI